MRILFLHGLMSSNQSKKIDWLKKEGHNVFHPLLNYKDDGKIIFKDLNKLIKDNQIELIVGSSMGGYLAYHLSNLNNMRSLIFNPSLSISKRNALRPEITHTINDSNHHTVVMGRLDDVVIPRDTISYLEDENANFTDFYEEYGHRTPLITFQKYCNKLLESKNTRIYG